VSSLLWRFVLKAGKVKGRVEKSEKEKEEKS